MLFLLALAIFLRWRLNEKYFNYKLDLFLISNYEVTIKTNSIGLLIFNNHLSDI